MVVNNIADHLLYIQILKLNNMLEVMIGALILLTVAIAGMGIKLLFNKNAEFTGGSCQSTYGSDELKNQGIGCGCSGECAGTEKK